MYTPIATLAALLATATAQTFTDCNPLKKTCPVDAGLKATTLSTDFTSSDDVAKNWHMTANDLKYTSSGAEFTINKRGEAPTIQSNFYMLFGTLEVKMKSSAGTGIISSIVLQSDDLDEVDWEFIGGVSNQVQSNYYGKGNTTTYDRVMYHDVSPSTQTESHTYKVDWTAQSMTWSIDDTAVRTLNYADAVGGQNYPQTPMNVRIGIWAGGDPSNNQGTIEWAGGKTNYDDAPFTMIVESVKITNNNPACEYKYTDKTGSWESIDILQTCKDLTTTSSKSVASITATKAAATHGSGSSDTTCTDAKTSSTKAAAVESQLASSYIAAASGSVIPWGPIHDSGSESSGSDASCKPVTVTVTKTVGCGASSSPIISSAAAEFSSTLPVVSTTTDITSTLVIASGTPPAPYSTWASLNYTMPIGSGTGTVVASSTVSVFTGAAVARATGEAIVGLMGAMAAGLALL